MPEYIFPIRSFFHPYEDYSKIEPIDIDKLGKNFFIKPAHGSGGEGVKRGSNSFAQILIARTGTSGRSVFGAKTNNPGGT